mmetsp:Transcript_1372/g.3532  ORF Transcript_1372/g.3532 Transcript_1372/m.3532 type:complete len:316 (-) Transcript_1372:60-1007(-)
MAGLLEGGSDPGCLKVLLVEVKLGWEGLFFVERCAGLIDAFRQHDWPTVEDAHPPRAPPLRLALTVRLCHLGQLAVPVRAPKLGDEVGLHACHDVLPVHQVAGHLAQFQKVGRQAAVALERGDVDVDVQHLVDVDQCDALELVAEPRGLLPVPRAPEEVHLLSGAPPALCAGYGLLDVVQHVPEHRGAGRDTDARADHHHRPVLLPGLRGRAKGAVHVDPRKRRQTGQGAVCGMQRVGGSAGLQVDVQCSLPPIRDVLNHTLQRAGPVAHGADLQADELVVRGGRQGERVPLHPGQRRKVDEYVLARQVGEARGL